ncbi:hypothetical protein M0R04_14925 [Candidatus Dojkabacteria bacterium]|nr:hypothetical protein [Candidatus Dojkabacteria bacterium]
MRIYYYVSPHDHWIGSIFIKNGMLVGSFNPNKAKDLGEVVGIPRDTIHIGSPYIFEGMMLSNDWN